MRILVLSGDYHPIISGGAFADTAVATAIAEDENDVTVVTFRSEGLSREEIHDGVEVKRPFRPPYNDSETNTLANFLGRMIGATVIFTYCIVFLLRNDIDVIFATNHIFHPVASVLQLIFRIPICSFIAYTPSLKPENKHLTNPLYVFEQANFRFFMGDIIFCRNPEIRDVIKKLNPESSARLAHGILDVAAIQSAVESIEEHDCSPRYQLEKEFGIESDSTLIAFVGRFSQLKQPERAAAIISELPPEYELVLVGDGERRQEVESTIAELGIENRVHILGLIPHEKVIQILYVSDHLILTSETESYPTVVFEALACSCTVVAPRIGILPYIDISDERLRLTALENFTGAIKELPRGDSKLETEVLMEYSIDRFAQDVLDSLETLGNNQS